MQTYKSVVGGERHDCERFIRGNERYICEPTSQFKPLPLIKNKKLRILKRDTLLSLSMKKTKKK
ncbi:hypothetical protein [Helicobacter cinaedi]|uniref:hypothetical protein n=1 Tax=Helicobacter cinaedi TaxID=213 RepID=UPI00105A7C18|nr:hypothetical protein [Helicobacter cinaedi]